MNTMKYRLEKKAHLIMLVVGLLNIAILPLWQLPIAKAPARAIGYPLFGVGLAINLLSLLALKGGFGGEIEPVTELVTSGIYARLRHPMYVSFAITMLGLDFLLRSALGILFTLVVFLPSMIWRARLEEQALARHFGQVWKDYVNSVPSLLLWDLRKKVGLGDSDVARRFP
jgi:protein-S-isoprenylcysteine O-methyltransferase Ste14